MENTEKKIKKKKKLSRSAVVLMISSIIILIPCLVFGAILLIAQLQNNKPVIGDRYENDLNPTITQANTDSITSSIEALSSVDSVEIVMTTAQYRINIDTKDSISEEEMETLASSIYDIVNKELPISTYFTKSSDGMKMYDLSITLYNYIPDGNDNKWISYTLTKNSGMSEKAGQFVSKPQDSNLVAELRGETNTDNQTTADDQTTSE